MSEQLTESLKTLLNTARFEDNLAKGLHEVCKSLESNYKGGRPALCILADNCQEQKYKDLVVALCKEKEVDLLKIEDRVALGEWVGLCQLDERGTARKIRGCSCVVIKEFSAQNASDIDIVKQHLVK